MAWSPKKRVVVCCSLGWILAILGVAMIPLAELVVKKVVQDTVVIREGGEVYDYWQDPPVPIYMQIYLFNLTNPVEFLAGAKPSLSQHGPYTYSEKRIKFNITWNDNGTVSYRQQRMFNFIPEMSPDCFESDIFLTPNPVIWALFNGIKFEDSKVKQVLEMVTKLLGSNILMTRTAREVVWGYDDPILKLAKEIDPDWFYTDFVGYFMNKNDTDDGVYTVITGEKDIDNLGVIDKYNGSKYLNFWSTEWANMVNGSDGTLGPPYIAKDRSLYVFASDVCRSVEGVFASDIELEDIKLWRYEASQYYLANATDNPDNLGFCTPQSQCLGKGIYNATTCQSVDFFHIPVALSLPHFLYADQDYIDAVEGMRPNPDDHKIAIDLEPYTGLVLQAAKRLQVNLYVGPIADIQETSQLTPVFYPVFWINESVSVDTKNADKLKRLLFTPVLALHILEIVIICIGLLIVIVTVMYHIKVYWKQHQHGRSGMVNGEDNTDTRPIINEEEAPDTSSQPEPNS